jgi:hypothetical protein
LGMYRQQKSGKPELSFCTNLAPGAKLACICTNFSVEKCTRSNIYILHSASFVKTSVIQCYDQRKMARVGDNPKFLQLHGHKAVCIYLYIFVYHNIYLGLCISKLRSKCCYNSIVEQNFRSSTLNYFLIVK